MSWSVFSLSVRVCWWLDLGFGEGDGPWVQVFFHPMLCLFAVVLLLFALLRFKRLAKLRNKNKRGQKCFERGAWSL